MSRRRGLAADQGQSLSLPLTLTVCVFVWVWLWIRLCCGCGKGACLCWCLSIAQKQHRLQFTLLYMEWMDPSQDICRKLILSSIHHLGFVCDSSFTVYTRKQWALHTLSKTFHWEMHVNPRLSAVLFPFGLMFMTDLDYQVALPIMQEDNA